MGGDCDYYYIHLSTHYIPATWIWTDDGAYVSSSTPFDLLVFFLADIGALIHHDIYQHTVWLQHKSERPQSDDLNSWSPGAISSSKLTLYC